MIKQNELVPKRRFTGFFEEWRKKTLDEVLDLLKDGTHGTHQNVKDGVYLLSAKNIKNGKVNFDKSDRQISMDEYRRIHRSFELKKGDILLTVVGSIGESAILKNKEKLTFQRSVAYLRPKEEITSQYLFTNTNSLNFQKELKNRQVVSAQPGIYLGDLSIIPIVYPTLKEQQKIGQFFKHLDDMIALQQRKIDKTKALKSAYLAEMFPAEGERVPKRRFEGFKKTWKKIKLERLFHQSGSGGTPRTTRKDYYGGNISFLGISDITNSDGYIYQTEKKITKEGLNNSAAWIVPKESISLAMYASVGKVAILKVESATSQAFYNMVIEDHATRDFVYQYLVKMEAENMWNKIISTGTQANLNAEKVRNLNILIPTDIKERKSIGNLFKNIDNLIATHQQKLEKLKAMKQAYLHEMFV